MGHQRSFGDFQKDQRISTQILEYIKVLGKWLEHQNTNCGKKCSLQGSGNPEKNMDLDLRIFVSKIMSPKAM